MGMILIICGEVDRIQGLRAVDFNLCGKPITSLFLTKITEFHDFGATFFLNRIFSFFFHI